MGIVEEVQREAGVPQYDARKTTSKRNYLQRVLHMERLGEKGVRSFSSGGPAAFFAALLQCRRQVQPGLSASA